MVAALESITLLSWLFTDSSPVPRRLQIASRATSCTSAMMEFMPCALTPAYGVTSICRFIQAATALSLDPTVARLSPWLSLGLLAFLFHSVYLCFLLLPTHLDHFASAFPHVQPSSLSGSSPCIYPAGAYCLRKVKDSNLRAISDSRVSSAVLSASQPTFQICYPDFSLSFCLVPLEKPANLAAGWVNKVI